MGGDPGLKVLKHQRSKRTGFLLNGSNAAENAIACGLKVKIIAAFDHGAMHEPMPLDLEGVKSSAVFRPDDLSAGTRLDQRAKSQLPLFRNKSFGIRH